MTTELLSPDEQRLLLQFARQAMEEGVRGIVVNPLDLESLPPRLRMPGATFVTLTIDGDLRGCIGALEPYQPLAEDVREHAVAAALDDYRFPPLQEDELPRVKIEISYLTMPEPLIYENPDELPERLRPGVDGVILRDGLRRATFLPQVWEKLPDVHAFLSHLCQKMGAPGDWWRRRNLQVMTYQVQEFHE
jgi:AmmeMemoRadiSam system protein A